MYKYRPTFIILSLITGLTVCTFTGCKEQDASNNTSTAIQNQAEPAQTAAQTEQTEEVAIQVKPSPDENTILEGYAFPNLEFTSLKGEQINLADFKGKVVLIDFWAVWCGPCIRVMPDVVKTYQQYHDKGFEIIGISLDRDKSQLEKYMQDNGITWPQYYDGLFWNNKISMRFGIRAIPHIVIVDKNGEVYFNTDYDKNKAPLTGERLSNTIADLCSS